MRLDGKDHPSSDDARDTQDTQDNQTVADSQGTEPQSNQPEGVELPEQFPEDPVIGDEVLTFPSLNKKETVMPAPDLPESVAAQLMTETVGNIQANNRDGRNVSTLAAGVLQGAMARNFDELGTIESRANSGVMATPIASPTTQQSRV